MTDEKLIETILAGNKEAFKELVKRYEPRVAAVVIGMLGQGAEAEDVGQEAFIRLYQSLNRFQGESSVGTYLTRIAINLSLNELKRRKRRWGLFLRISDETLEIRDDREDISANLEKKIVRTAVQKLKPDLRAVIVLRHIEGHSIEETAAILQIPPGTVMSRQARAKKKLRTLLSDLAGGS